MGTSVHPRIIVTLTDGVIESVVCDNLPDLVGTQVILIDTDIEGCDHTNLTDVGSKPMWFSVQDLAQADDDTSRDVAAAYDNWSLT